MQDDPIWRAFASTGDPLYYLLYKTVQAGEKKNRGENPAGQTPRPVD